VKWTWAVTVVFCVFYCAPLCYAADGNELYAIGAIQNGMGGAGIAAPRDATWALMNPASLVDLDKRIDISFELLYNDIFAEPRGLALLSNPLVRRLNDTNLIPIPSLGLVWPLDKGTLGFGVFGVECNEADYKRPTATLALLQNGARHSSYQVVKFPLAYGYRFDNGWAIGGAVVPTSTRFRSDSLTLKLRPTQGDSRWDSALGIGFELAVYRRWNRWSFGATYSSRIWMERYNKYEHDLMPWSLDLPQELRVGVAYRPTKDVEIALDYKRSEWSSIRLLANKTIRGGLRWEDQQILKAGVNWDVNKRWSLRAGVSYGNAPVDNNAVWANMLTPALSELHIAAGFSYKVNDHVAYHVGYVYVIPNDRTDNGKGDLFSILGRGTRIGYQEQSLTVQYSYSF